MKSMLTINQSRLEMIGDFVTKLSILEDNKDHISLTQRQISLIEQVLPLSEGTDSLNGNEDSDVFKTIQTVFSHISFKSSLKQSNSQTKKFFSKKVFGDSKDKDGNTPKKVRIAPSGSKCRASIELRIDGEDSPFNLISTTQQPSKLVSILKNGSLSRLKLFSSKKMPKESKGSIVQLAASSKFSATH
jgi:hypothetical protein